MTKRTNKILTFFGAVTLASVLFIIIGFSFFMVLDWHNKNKTYLYDLTGTWACDELTITRPENDLHETYGVLKLDGKEYSLIIHLLIHGGGVFECAKEGVTISGPSTPNDLYYIYWWVDINIAKNEELHITVDTDRTGNNAGKKYVLKKISE